MGVVQGSWGAGALLVFCLLVEFLRFENGDEMSFDSIAYAIENRVIIKEMADRFLPVKKERAKRDRKKYFAEYRKTEKRKAYMKAFRARPEAKEAHRVESLKRYHQERAK